jgi:hypothetical protein
MQRFEEDSWLMSQSAANLSLRRGSLLNREKNREFFDFGRFPRATVQKVVFNSGGYERIPYAAEQGNNS